MNVFLQSVFAQLLLTPYIFWRGWQALPPRKVWRMPYLLFFVIELLIFFTGFFFHKALPDQVMIPILYFCGTWYITSIYLTLALFVVELLRVSDKWVHWIPQQIKKHWRATKLTFFSLITIGVGLLMAYANLKVVHPVVKHIPLTIPKGSSTRDNLTVVMMSDLHIGEVIGKKMVQKYVRLSNEQHPDMVVLVGDIMDYESRFAEKEKIEEDIQQLEAPLGTYIVYGNHEYRANRHAKERWFRKTGATLLVDSVVMPDSSFYLVGRDDYINKQRKPLRHLIKDLDPDKPVIVLDHQPWSFTEQTMNGVDLGLHGHTHYGQIWPYSLLLKFVYECPYGYYRKGDTQFYVSSGIGIAGPPYRVGTDSELVVLHITFSE
ncbi:metallophosphoesterase [Parabacteroides sp. PF5-9]|uniref:metallophosphoesterase n=1 Tax=Parabacteroides sp. PF5-9 TaxID=1742404 RepID=UPI002474AE1D|nr:metallophosphoesterase [Parabacteroides sp. PF5-9]MDH6359188.1 putative MPP superfamily phosphohydrolase [Parabacteroides sp. PF5-9]